MGVSIVFYFVLVVILFRQASRKITTTFFCQPFFSLLTNEFSRTKHIYFRRYLPATPHYETLDSPQTVKNLRISIQLNFIFLRVVYFQEVEDDGSTHLSVVPLSNIFLLPSAFWHPFASAKQVINQLLLSSIYPVGVKFPMPSFQIMCPKMLNISF